MCGRSGHIISIDFLKDGYVVQCMDPPVLAGGEDLAQVLRDVIYGIGYSLAERRKEEDYRRRN